ncbi:hypothetical protein RM717_18725 [Streptomyces griseus]|uniref:5'-nucleotidase n=2 Tax=Streptomyces TaxID=1883 RepID=A0ABU2W3W0_9ACTN|nr:hypothetical protein [Streptomyces griseus]MDT0492545.1 hypothetical protein [Streptomyces griseus]
MYKRMLRSALAAAFVVALGLGLQAADGIGGSGGAVAKSDIGWTADIGWKAPGKQGGATSTVASGDIGWFGQTRVPGDIGWSAQAGVPGDLGWSAPADSVA